LLGPVAVAASELPAGAARLIVAAAFVHGAWLTHREWRRPIRQLLFTADGRLLVDGMEASRVRLEWRGPLAFLAFDDPAGRRIRLAWWPDTLPPTRRRELRLAAGGLPAARDGPSMAP